MRRASHCAARSPSADASYVAPSSSRPPTTGRHRVRPRSLGHRHAGRRARRGSGALPRRRARRDVRHHRRQARRRATLGFTLALRASSPAWSVLVIFTVIFTSSGVSSKRRREESRVRTRPKPVATTSDCRLLLANDIARADAERDPLDRQWVRPTVRNKHHPTPPRWSDSACGVRPTADHGARKSVTLSKHNASGPRAASEIARARWAAGACGA